MEANTERKKLGKLKLGIHSGKFEWSWRYTCQVKDTKFKDSVVTLTGKTLKDDGSGGKSYDQSVSGSSKNKEKNWCLLRVEGKRLIKKEKTYHSDRETGLSG